MIRKEGSVLQGPLSASIQLIVVEQTTSQFDPLQFILRFRPMELQSPSSRIALTLFTAR